MNQCWMGIRSGRIVRWNNGPMIRLAPLITLAILVFTCAGSAQQDPILVTFDLHVDPVNNRISEIGKAETFQERTEWMNWVLDQTEPFLIPISFLSSGWYMERVVAGGPSADGASLVRRIHANGAQIGSHHHNEFRAGAFDWPTMDSDAPLSLARTQWRHNIEWVNAGIQTALGDIPSPLVRRINRAKGAHAPMIPVEYHQLMREFGLDVREPGPEEDYYGYFGHHIWHPYRPSANNELAEDLTAPFVQVPAGPVIGNRSVHHGTLQDMRPAAMKKQFLQLYLNWRNANRTGSDPKVWSWGWGSHAHNFDPSEASRSALLEMLSWIETHFRNRKAPDDSPVMQYATHLEVADAYLDWEVANPDMSSFSFDSLVQEDWTTYPWLRAVAEEMRDYLWESDLELPDVEAFQLDRDGQDAVLLWGDDVTKANVDLADIFSGQVRVVELDSGLILSDSANIFADQIPITSEPLWITAISDSTVLKGDVDNDGRINNLDITPFIAALSATDAAAFLAVFPEGNYAAADIDMSGYPNNLDITPFIALLTSTDETAATVPESSVLACLAFGLMTIAPRRPKRSPYKE